MDDEPPNWVVHIGDPAFFVNIEPGEEEEETNVYRATLHGKQVMAKKVC
jgi:hypothetical protein